jgi:hypothetical protein
LSARYLRRHEAPFGFFVHSVTPSERIILFDPLSPRVETRLRARLAPAAVHGNSFCAHISVDGTVPAIKMFLIVGPYSPRLPQAYFRGRLAIPNPK